MNFDFSKVREEAKKVVENKNGGYKYSLLYPGIGTTRVKLLFNEKSNTLMRLINRHTVLDNSKIACTRTYGDFDCPVCKIIDDAEHATGLNLYKFKSKARGIAYAQLVGVDYQLTNKNINEGDIILFMFPWSVYKEINEIIGSMNDDNKIKQLCASNEGMIFDIRHGSDNRYNVQIDPFDTKYRTCKTDEEFDKLLSDLDSLDEQILPSKINNDIEKQIKDACVAFTAQFLTKGRETPNINNNVQQSQNLSNINNNNQNNQNVQQQSFMEQTQNQMNNNQSTKPDCYGNHGKEDQNKCMLCPYEVNCMEDSLNQPPF